VTSPTQRTNSLNLVRFICAFIVLVSHLDWIAGNPRDLLRDAGICAVGVFFGISGYLLTASALNSFSFRNFLRNRFLRIYPGFFVALTLTSFVFAPIYTWRECSSECNFNVLSIIEYFFSNLTIHIGQPGIAGTLQESAVEKWNPSLWTLEYEVISYFFLSLIYLFNELNKMKASFVLLGMSAFIYISSLAFPFLPYSSLKLIAYFQIFFFFGSCLYFLKAFMSYRFYKLLAILLLMYFNHALKYPSNIAELKLVCYGLLCIFLALMVGLHFRPFIFKNNDYSFGIYIYAGPVTHLVLLFWSSIADNWLIYSTTVCAITLIFAIFSWHCVEKPSLKFKVRSRLKV
jgi:peptidoglycan/LPS O-acetylase OafA/YrhL